jgi:hypothetical protein
MRLCPPFGADLWHSRTANVGFEGTRLKAKHEISKLAQANFEEWLKAQGLTSTALLKMAKTNYPPRSMFEGIESAIKQASQH